jgi:hypothetical protein
MKVKLWLAAAAAFSVLAFAGSAGSAAAQASTSSYCGGTLTAGQYCVGAQRWLYQAYGWGDQGGVCVAVWEYTVQACTSAANTGVYSANVGQNVWTYPFIRDNFNGANNVHGVALTH